jgi:hypothetical protein
MNLIVYASERQQRKRLLSAINACSHQWIIEIFTDFPSLDKRLRRICAGESWLLIITADSEELKCLIMLRDIIKDQRSIIVLPDHQRETVIVGHTLYPRFISYLDSDFSDVRSVLATVINKMDEKYSKKKIQEVVYGNVKGSQR